MLRIFPRRNRPSSALERAAAAVEAVLVLPLWILLLLIMADMFFMARNYIAMTNIAHEALQISANRVQVVIPGRSTPCSGDLFDTNSPASGCFASASGGAAFENLIPGCWSSNTRRDSLENTKAKNGAAVCDDPITNNNLLGCGHRALHQKVWNLAESARAAGSGKLVLSDLVVVSRFTSPAYTFSPSASASASTSTSSLSMSTPILQVAVSGRFSGVMPFFKNIRLYMRATSSVPSAILSAQAAGTSCPATSRVSDLSWSYGTSNGPVG